MRLTHEEWAAWHTILFDVLNRAHEIAGADQRRPPARVVLFQAIDHLLVVPDAPMVVLGLVCLSQILELLEKFDQEWYFVSLHLLHCLGFVRFRRPNSCWRLLPRFIC
jgi:hypothetical protein